jgi:LysM repeat protein
VPATEQAKFDGFKDRLIALRVKGLKNVAKRDNEKPQMHLVESGDTLPHIASIYGLSVKKIRQLNSLSSPRITPGMRLVLVDQRKSVGSLVEVGRSTEAYRVRSGDSLHSIAKRFGTSIQTLKRLNGLRHNRVATGQVLKIREVKG